MVTTEMMFSPEKHGLVECPQCNGYGSCLKEEADRCTKCKGAGLIKKEGQCQENS